jgi:hypothetical protein
MKKLLLLLVLLTSFISKGQTITRLVGASPFQDSLWVMDTVNFTTVHRRLSPVMTGSTITGITGLTKHPGSGRIWVICKVSGLANGRILGKYNLLTNSVTPVGDLGDKFSSITFKGDTLFGVTGNGATVPETLYRIDTTNASKTLAVALGNGADGEIICYNPSDNFIYHWSGNSSAVTFEKIQSFAPYTITSIVTATTGETFGAVNVGPTRFITSNINSSFNRYTSTGVTTASFGSTPDDLRGLAIVNCSRVIAGNTAYCVGDSTQLTASAGTSYQWFKNGVAIPSATNQIYFAKSIGKYNCRLSDMCGLDSGAVGVTISQNALPIVSISGPTTVCSGNTITLTASGGGTSQWYKNGVAIPSATAITLVVNSSGVYNMIKTNTNGCKDSAAIGKIVVVRPTPTLTVNSATICSGTSHTFVPSGAVTYTYSSGSAIVSPTATTNYTISGTSSLSCVGTVTTSVLVNTLPTITAVSNTSLICVGQSASLTASGASSYTWNTTANTATIVVSPSVTTSYTVNGTGANGCSNVTTITQNVSTCAGIDNINLNKTLGGVEVYPNPASSVLNVKCSVFNGSVTKLEIVNCLGQIVLTEQISSQITQLEISQFPKGIYFMQIFEGKRIIESKKIVKE